MVRADTDARTPARCFVVVIAAKVTARTNEIEKATNTIRGDMNLRSFPKGAPLIDSLFQMRLVSTRFLVLF
jgi:hypothetical protein